MGRRADLWAGLRGVERGAGVGAKGVGARGVDGSGEGVTSPARLRAAEQWE